MLEMNAVNVVFAYSFVVLILAMVRSRGMKREKEILVSSFRMTFQLVLAGYVLTFVFANPSPYLVLFIFLVMETFAVFNIFERVKGKLSSELKKIIGLSMFLGTGFSLFFFIIVVMGMGGNWFSPRYFIPIGGMIIGNSMTGISIGVNRLVSGLRDRKDAVEAALMLGATPEKAVWGIVNEAFDAALLPRLNNMVGMGIVFLPGMMTGQILAGASPMVSIAYQIVIMLGITGAVTLSVFMFTHYGYRTFFSGDDRFLTNKLQEEI